MKYKLFGNTGLRVSEICLGTMTFGKEVDWGSSKEEAQSIFDAYANIGGNFIDTANKYTNGTSEKFLGDFIKKNREYFVLATKYTGSMNPTDPNAGGNSRKNMMQSVEASLKRLDTEYIDILWLHIWDETTPAEEIMRGLDDLIRSGKVNYVGISDTPAWVIAKCNTLAELRGWSAFVGLQIEYNLIERSVEQELIPLAKHFKMTVTPWSPLRMGILAGKYTRETKGPKRLDTLTEFYDLDERSLVIAKKVDEIADNLNKSSAQVALNWLRAQENMVPIIGARTLEQLNDNLACTEWNLYKDDINALNEVSKLDPIFPNNFWNKPFVREFVFGKTESAIDK